MHRPRPNLPPLSIPHDEFVEQWLDRFDDPDSIDENPEYSLNLGAESPASTYSFDERIPTPPPRVLARRRSQQRLPRKRDAVDRDCGICFEYAVHPSRTLCCGKIFCQEHIAAWLHGPSSDGRCPSCSAPCSSETHILSLAPLTLIPKPPSCSKLPSHEPEVTNDHHTRGRSQSASTSASKQSQASESSLTSSSDGTIDSSVLGLTPTPEEDPEDGGQHLLAYAIGLGHSRQSTSSGPSPYPFIEPGSSTIEVISRLASVMGLTLLFYALLAS